MTAWKHNLVYADVVTTLLVPLMCFCWSFLGQQRNRCTCCQKWKPLQGGASSVLWDHVSTLSPSPGGVVTHVWQVDCQVSQLVAALSCTQAWDVAYSIFKQVLKRPLKCACRSVLEVVTNAALCVSNAPALHFHLPVLDPSAQCVCSFLLLSNFENGLVSLNYMKCDQWHHFSEITYHMGHVFVIPEK